MPAVPITLMRPPPESLDERLEGDIHYICELFAGDRGGSQRSLHKHTRSEVEYILDQYGSRFHLEEIGPGAWSRGLPYSVPDFLIVDKLYPDGPPVGTRLSSMPRAYKAQGIAYSLDRLGFTVFVESPDLGLLPWDTYFDLPLERRGFIPPLRLRVAGTHGTLPFTLSMPDPTAGLRVQLWSIIAERPEFRQLLAVLIIWARSWEMTDLTPTVLAYLTFRFMQELNHASEQQPTNSKHPDINFEGALFCCVSGSSLKKELIAYGVEANLRVQVPDVPMKTHKLLVLFFRSEMIKGYLFHQGYKEPISSAQAMLRLWLPGNLGNNEGRPIRVDPRDLFSQEPVDWRHSGMICVDPFFPRWNQSEFVASKTMRRMRVKAESAYTLLWTKNPLISIFGPHLDAPARTLRWDFKGMSFGSPTIFPPLRQPGRKLSFIDKKRAQIILRVQSAIEHAYGPRYEVCLFGSVSYKASHDDSDLDLVIVDKDRMNGFPPSLNLDELPPIYNLKFLGNTLRKAGFEIKDTIRFAAVPIVKFFDPKTNIDCDINVNDQLGAMNTVLIRLYCETFPPLREMLRRIKAWARPIGLNDSSGALGNGRTFNSYSFALMTIGFLQTKNLLPNFQANLAGMKEKVFWIRRKANRIKCDIRHHHSLLWSPPTSIPSLQVLLQEWFRYWAYEFDYDGNEMNIRLGGEVQQGSNVKDAEGTQVRVYMGSQVFPGEDLYLPDAGGQNKAENSADLGNQTRLSVMDPFNLSSNCTNGIGPGNIKRFQAECRRALFFAAHESLDNESFCGNDTQSDDKDPFTATLKAWRRKLWSQAIMSGALGQYE